MLNRAAGVFGLDSALQVQHFKHIIRIVDGQLRRVGVERLVALLIQFFVGADDFGVALFIQFSQAVGGPFRRSGFKL